MRREGDGLTPAFAVTCTEVWGKLCRAEVVGGWIFQGVTRGDCALRTRRKHFFVRGIFDRGIDKFKSEHLVSGLGALNAQNVAIRDLDSCLWRHCNFFQSYCHQQYESWGCVETFVDGMRGTSDHESYVACGMSNRLKNTMVLPAPGLIWIFNERAINYCL